MVLNGTGIYDFTALLPSGGSVGLQGLTVPNGGGWLTLRNDGTYQFSNGSDNLLHVLVMNLQTGPVPNTQVIVYYTGSSNQADSGTTGSDGQVAFIVTPYTPSTINFTVVSAGNGTVSPSGTITPVVDSTVQITAMPAQGYVFDHWEMSPTNPDIHAQNPLSIKMVSGYNNATLTAYFVEGTGSIPWGIFAAFGVAIVFAVVVIVSGKD